MLRLHIATAMELNSVDLYAHLSSMLKNSADELDVAEERNTQKGKNDKTQPAPSKRELGRLKNKRALARAVQGRHGDKDVREGIKDSTEMRDNKRSKSEGSSENVDEEPMDII